MGNDEKMIEGLQSDLAEVKTTLGKIADALTRLAVLEERQSAVVAVLNRVSDRQDKAEERNSALSNEMIRLATTANVISRGIFALWITVGAGVLAELGHLAIAVIK